MGDLQQSSPVDLEKECGSSRHEIPPWGQPGKGRQIWWDGRPISGDPERIDMKELFLELGFYESSKEEMGQWIRAETPGSKRAEAFTVSDDDLYFNGLGANPKVEIHRTRKNRSISLEVYVDNRFGYDQNISWRYKIRYDSSIGRWVFEEIGTVRGHLVR